MRSPVSAVNYDAAIIESRPANVAVQFQERVHATPDREAFRYPVGDSWESVTWAQAGERVRRDRRAQPLDHIAVVVIVRRLDQREAELAARCC